MKPSYRSAIRKKQKIKEDYNATSDFYDNRYRFIQRAKYKAILKDIKIDSKNIIDAGCGTGLLVEELDNFIKFGDSYFHYIGNDISLEMLYQFKRKLIGKNDIRKYCSLVLADIENLPFRKDIFNLVFAITSLQNLSNIKQGIKNLKVISKRDTLYKITILKKNLNLRKLSNILHKYFRKYEIKEIENCEDIIISLN